MINELLTTTYFSLLKKWDKKTQIVGIRCPFCLRVQINFNMNAAYSFHGSCFKIFCENDDCAQEFFVEELVSRQYIIGKTSSEMVEKLKSLVVKQ